MAAIQTPGNAGPPDGPPGGAIVHRDLVFDGSGAGETAFHRADLVLEGVDHAQGSYEVRVFFNNTAADETTPRSPEAGYAGRLVVFGHGNCFGAAGHCDSTAAAAATAERGALANPLVPQTRMLTITDPLRRALASPAKRLETLTFVPIAKTPRRDRRGLAAGLFKFRRLSLRTYR